LLIHLPRGKRAAWTWPAAYSRANQAISQESIMTANKQAENVRSESLLPADPDGVPSDDAALQVAEEVAFDQQSARVRGLGNFPKDGAPTPEGKAADAVAETLKGGKEDGGG
jgi:hypothetical protein